ncbi:hypothetical protein FA379_23305 [Pseudomonas aeruginosa]|nr:hypothetical protein [Pseudomonas aeruginosa]MCO2235748.1 hypothetical protein [Pseudomonas aeruginosa]MCO2241270.1 hypothetical protein [Pseudomonas aeruginosa]MCO2337232.1 hypothetical protein [Pseudomonas aeruginosa]MCO2359701.1 hypothetical protein [Pseudomonas aeruginosa]
MPKRPAPVCSLALRQSTALARSIGLCSPGAGGLPASLAMTDTLALRGPDAQGVWKHRNALLGHRLRRSLPAPAGQLRR